MLLTVRILVDLGGNGTTTRDETSVIAGESTSSYIGNEWNTFTTPSADSTIALRDTNGATTGVSLKIGNKAYNTRTPDTVPNGLSFVGEQLDVGEYPASAVRDGFRVDASATGIEWKVEGVAAMYALGFTTAEVRLWGNCAGTTTHRVSLSGASPASFNCAQNHDTGTAVVRTFVLTGATTSLTLVPDAPSADDFGVISVVDIRFMP